MSLLQSPLADSRETRSSTVKDERDDDEIEYRPESDNEDERRVPDGDSYKRTSRRGAPKRFVCDCGHAYTRAEHLRRHQLNHSSKKPFTCDEPSCHLSFVRPDLLARHRERHEKKREIRRRSANRKSSSPATPSSAFTPLPHPATSRIESSSSAALRPRPAQFPTGQPRDAAVLLTPESNATATPTLAAVSNGLPSRVAQPAMTRSGINTMPLTQPMVWPSNPLNPTIKRPYPPTPATTVVSAQGLVSFPAVQSSSPDENNFTMWLFDPQAGNQDFSVFNIPFLEGGMESTLSSYISYDQESLGGPTMLDISPAEEVPEVPEELGLDRRDEILGWFDLFRKKLRHGDAKRMSYEARLGRLAYENGGDYPNIHLGMMRDCLGEFWDYVSPRMPIVHRPTFSCNRSPWYLLMVMIALGAASLRNRDATGSMAEYGSFADVIISGLRWEIQPLATPPVGLSEAQALLLVEFYEKYWSSREFHERAHIYHSATLTLLRRGNQLFARNGSESPQEGPSGQQQPRSQDSFRMDTVTSWGRWAESESMRRVVFAAFMLDILNAAMFGHDVVMAPHEIRLPLPCMDSVWTASNPDQARAIETDLRRCGRKELTFLEALKRALHEEEVRTHAFGRMVIMAGLLSVGYHLKNRETQFKWLARQDSRPQRIEEQEGWKTKLLRAFDRWKESFDRDPASECEPTGHSNGPVQTASLLYHLAHVSLNVSVIDCQVYAGARRLLGRDVSVRDYQNSEARLVSWARLPNTRHAIRHAFIFLHRVLVGSQLAESHDSALVALVEAASGETTTATTTTTMRNAGSGATHHLDSSVMIPNPAPYSIRRERDPHRTWMLYLATLSIWCFVRASGIKWGPQGQLRTVTMWPLAAYLSRVAHLPELDAREAATLGEGLADLLSVVMMIFEDGFSELVAEARDRLRVCACTPP